MVGQANYYQVGYMPGGRKLVGRLSEGLDYRARQAGTPFGEEVDIRIEDVIPVGHPKIMSGLVSRIEVSDSPESYLARIDEVTRFADKEFPVIEEGGITANSFVSVPTFIGGSGLRLHDYLLQFYYIPILDKQG